MGAHIHQFTKINIKRFKNLMNILIVPGEGIEHLVLPPQLRLLATKGQPALALYVEILIIILVIFYPCFSFVIYISCIIFCDTIVIFSNSPPCIAIIS